MDNIISGSVSSKIPNWVSDIKTNYPNYIKNISDVEIVHINDVEFESLKNLARHHAQINQTVKNQIRDDIDENGFRETEEPIVLIRNKQTASVSIPKPFLGNLCIHRLTAITQTTGTGKAKFKKTFPAVIVDIQDGLTKHEVDFITAIFGIEENGNRRATSAATVDDYTMGAYHMCVNLTINGRKATTQQKMKWIEKELRKMKRNGSETWTRSSLIRNVLKKLRRLFDIDGVAHKRHSFALGQEWIDKHYGDEFEVMGEQLDNVKISGYNSGKFQRPYLNTPHKKSIVLFWPSNRMDRNPYDIKLAYETMESEDEKVPIDILLSVDCLDKGDLLQHRKDYARSLIELRDMFNEDVRSRINFIGFLPQHDSEDMTTLISFREFQKQYLSETSKAA